MKIEDQSIKEVREELEIKIKDYLKGVGEPEIARAHGYMRKKLMPVVVISGLHDEAIYDNEWMMSWENEMCAALGERPFLVITGSSDTKEIEVNVSMIEPAHIPDLHLLIERCTTIVNEKGPVDNIWATPISFDGADQERMMDKIKTSSKFWKPFVILGIRFQRAWDSFNCKVI